MSVKYNSFKDKLFDSINVILLIISLLLCAYPFYYILIYSISDPQMAQGGIFFKPAGFSLEVFKKIFQMGDIASAFSVSVFRTVVGTLVTVLCSSLMAYLVTQKDYPMRKFIYRFLVITMYFNAGLIPWYLTIKALCLKNNFLVYILPAALNAFYVILIKTFIEQLPEALEESAKIDGAGFLTIFRKIIFPMSIPIIATISVFAAVAQWNSWIDTYFFVTKKSLYTAQYLLYSFLMQAEALSQLMRTDGAARGHAAVIITPLSIKMAITMIVTIPVLFIYPFMQKYFIKGITLGAVKG